MDKEDYVLESLLFRTKPVSQIAKESKVSRRALIYYMQSAYSLRADNLNKLYNYFKGDRK